MKYVMSLWANLNHRLHSLWLYLLSLFFNKRQRRSFCNAQNCILKQWFKSTSTTTGHLSRVLNPLLHCVLS